MTAWVTRCQRPVFSSRSLGTINIMWPCDSTMWGVPVTGSVTTCATGGGGGGAVDGGAGLVVSAQHPPPEPPPGEVDAPATPCGMRDSQVLIASIAMRKTCRKMICLSITFDAIGSLR